MVLGSISVSLVQGLTPVALGADSTFLPLFFNGPNLWLLSTLLMSTCLSPSQDTGTKVIGKRAETALASSGWTGVSWSPGSQCLLSVKVHLWKEMRVHEMIKPLVPM